MAASVTYVIKSVVYTPTTGGAVTILGIESVSYRKGGQVVTHKTDATVAVSAHFFDSIEGLVTVKTKDASWLAHAAFQGGVVGSLVITYQKRAKGAGAVAGQDKVVTAAQAMVGEVEAELPEVDRSDLSIPFHCSDDSGLTPFAFS